ncbi:hypothetical protein [Flavobacterium sp. LAR06]|uniref:hypothetical protein n=1 Tax=Flavobacterium sp. LAR06 TaxID=3064897 RepID=UPI0035BED21D
MKSLFKKQETSFTYHKYFHFAQAKWAQKMDVLLNGLSRRKLICLLVLFTIFTTAYFVYNIYAAFSKSNNLTVQNTTVIAKIKINNSKK